MFRKKTRLFVISSYRDFDKDTVHKNAQKNTGNSGRCQYEINICDWLIIL